MNFLNAMLLGGGLAFTVPLLIHLLRREKYRRVDWGAMQWLQEVEESSSRMPRWSTLLLLLNRIAIPILLAMALARPVLTSFASPSASGSSSVAVLIDNSLSMSADGAGTTVLQKAKRLVDQVLRNEAASGNISDIAVYTTIDERPLVDTTLDLEKARVAIRQITHLHRRNTPIASIRAALERLQNSDARNLQLLIVSDYQNSTWRSVQQDFAALLDSLEKEVAVTFASPPAGDQFRNVSLHLNRPAKSCRIGQPLRITATVKGLETGQEIQVTMSVDGQVYRRQKARGQSSSNAMTEFACKFTEAGTHSITLSLDVDFARAKNSIPDDDRAHHVVRVDRPPQVALIASSSSPATDFITAALQPFQESSAQTNRFRVLRLPANEVSAKQLESVATVIAILDQPLREAARSALVQFVANGGGLVAIPTAKTDCWSNLTLSDQPLLPFRYTTPSETVVGSLLLPESLPSELEQLRPTLAATLTRTRITQSSTLRNHQVANGNPKSLLVGSSGPLIAMREAGKGLIVQFAFSPSPGWTNLQIQPAFVPLFQEIVAVASANTAPEQSWFAGERLPKRLADRASELVAVDIADQVRGNQIIDGSIINYAGLYRLPPAPDEFAETFTTRIYPPESSVDRMPAKDMDAWAATIDATHVNSADEFNSVQTRRRNGVDVWRWFLIAVVCLLVSEIWLASQITRGGQ
ncbi:MAG: BatA domain-containing protein [Aureliella sp.]